MFGKIKSIIIMKYITFTMPLFALLYAFFEQYRGYSPCHLCWIERYIYVFYIIFAFILLIKEINIIKYIMLILSLLEVAVCFFHIGVEKHLWSSSCAVSFNTSGNLLSLPSVTGPMCDDVVWKMWGLSMVSYNIIFAFFLTILTMLLLRNKK